MQRVKLLQQPSSCGPPWRQHNRPLESGRCEVRNLERDLLHFTNPATSGTMHRSGRKPDTPIVPHRAKKAAASAKRKRA